MSRRTAEAGTNFTANKGRAISAILLPHWMNKRFYLQQLEERRNILTNFYAKARLFFYHLNFAKKKELRKFRNSFFRYLW